MLCRTRWFTSLLILMACGVISSGAFAAEPTIDPDRDPVWTKAYEQGEMSADETRAFMKQLAEFAIEHHMQRGNVLQRGMMYEYWHVSRAGEHDQFIQGEALDTMHDGAWFAIAMVNAYRATGDNYYKEVLVRWQLPFYLDMLNHSDRLFTTERVDVRPGNEQTWQNSKEWLLQGREKGFVPYWWDSGNSVSLEMINRKDELLSFPGRNDLAGTANPRKRLSGYSHGSSNHLAQDLAVMIQQCWLLLHDGNALEQKLAAELVEAAKNLQACRARHGSPTIPAVIAALATVTGDAELRKKLPEESWQSLQTARSDYRRALFEFKPDQPQTLPGFADDQQYQYYTALAKRGEIAPPVAFRLIYDAFTLPKLYEIYSDDSPVPPGINIFDLHPYRFVNGKPTDKRSDRKGPSQRPKPIGSRFGPQNMVVSGWALQLLDDDPHLWEVAQKHLTAEHYFPTKDTADVKRALRRELGCGLRTWEAIFDAKGYIPTSLGAGSCGAGFAWDELSDTGGYAHLISAAAQWLMYKGDEYDWETHKVPIKP